MKAYRALINIYLKLTWRDRAALFFTYVMPLVFFFMFSELNHAENGLSPTIVNMVFTIGILGTGLFGAGMRATMEREANVLRRFKVAPLGPVPILVASTVVGLLTFLPIYVVILVLANRMYGMPVPANLISLTLFVLIGLAAFRAIGLIVASVANSSQEATVLIQSLYLPMLFLSGATLPLTIMPNWVQTLAEFLPATHLFTGMQSILVQGKPLAQNWFPVVALLTTAAVATFIAAKLFRWEKEEKAPASAKLWVVAVLVPFLAAGIWQTVRRDNLARNKKLDREVSRNVNYLVRNARIFLGDGTVIERGAVLMRQGRIEEVFTGDAPPAKELRAREIEAAGKTLLPGLIDVHVHLGAPGGVVENPADYRAGNVNRELAAYLYSGVTAVRSVGDLLSTLTSERQKLRDGEHLGAELFLTGPLFTAEGGHGTEYFPKGSDLGKEFVRLPKSADEARQQVNELKGIDAIKAVLEAGGSGMLFQRMDTAVLNAIVSAAHARHLPVAVHTGNARDVADAIAAGADSIEHGSLREKIPAPLFIQMKERGAAYDPTLAVWDGVSAFRSGRSDPIDRSLVQQVGPAKLLAATRRALANATGPAISLDTANANLAAAYQAGVMLVAGTDSGNVPLVHGPGVHRELQLWVQAGVPAAVALQGATWNAARVLKAEDRIGAIKKGYEATLLLVDGDPTKDISATERISAVFFKGERINRQELFEDDAK